MTRATSDRRAVMVRAARAPRDFNDERFRAGYQGQLLASGCDACVLAAVRWALGRPELDRRRGHLRGLRRATVTGRQRPPRMLPAR